MRAIRIDSLTDPIDAVVAGPGSAIHLFSKGMDSGFVRLRCASADAPK
jgi:hypothetical protein